MKKLFWSLALISAFVIGCSKPEEERKPEPKPEEPENPVTPEEPGHVAECDWADYLISLDFTTSSTTAYYFTDVNYSTLKHKDGKLVHELLDFGSWDEMVAAMGELGGSPETGAEVLYMGNDPGTGYDITQAFNTNGIGYWCNGQGGVQDWGDNARLYTEAYFDEAGALIADVGVMEGKTKAGETYTCRMVFQRTKSETEILRVGIEFKVTIEEFVDPEAGKYNSANRKTGTFDIDPVTLTVPVNVFYDGVSADLSVIQDYLQLTKYEITQLEAALYDEQTGELLKGLDVTNFVNGEAVAPNAGGIGGNWMLDEATVGGWGVENGSWFIELHAELEGIYIAVGTMPGDEGVVTDLDAALVGKTAEYKQVLTYIPDFDAAPTILNLSYIINFVEAQ